MSLIACTFTGVDETTSLQEVKELSVQYPFIEWGFLVSSNETGKTEGGRYPSEDWYAKNRQAIIDLKESGVALAMHVCRSEVKNILEGNDCLAVRLLPLFKRVQINFISRKYDLSKLDQLMENNPEIQFITQHNNANVDLKDMFQSRNHAILFDSSGGRGIENDTWVPPLNDKLYGYAGGLGPDNIEKQLSNIVSVVGNRDYWIDMENKIRIDDKLSLEICRQVAVGVQSVLDNQKKIKNEI